MNEFHSDFLQSIREHFLSLTSYLFGLNEIEEASQLAHSWRKKVEPKEFPYENILTNGIILKAIDREYGGIHEVGLPYLIQTCELLFDLKMYRTCMSSTFDLLNFSKRLNKEYEFEYATAILHQTIGRLSISLIRNNEEPIITLTSLKNLCVIFLNTGPQNYHDLRILYLNMLGEVFIEQKNSEVAQRCFKKALRTINSNSLECYRAGLLQGLVRAKMLCSTSEESKRNCIDILTEALHHAREHQNLIQIGEILRDLGLLCYLVSLEQEAEKYLTESCSIFEKHILYYTRFIHIPYRILARMEQDDNDGNQNDESELRMRNVREIRNFNREVVNLPYLETRTMHDEQISVVENIYRNLHNEFLSTFSEEEVNELLSTQLDA